MMFAVIQKYLPKTPVHLLLIFGLLFGATLSAQADYMFNGIRYSNPYNPYNPLPNSSPNLPPGYTGTYNPYINQPPGVTIINSGYAYPMVISSPGYTVLRGRHCCGNNNVPVQTRVQVHYDRPVMQMGPLFNTP